MAVAETRAPDNLKAARMRLDVVRDNHVGASSSSFCDPPFELFQTKPPGYPIRSVATISIPNPPSPT
jgi:hypothetical protein